MVLVVGSSVAAACRETRRTNGMIDFGAREREHRPTCMRKVEYEYPTPTPANFNRIPPGGLVVNTLAAVREVPGSTTDRPTVVPLRG